MNILSKVFITKISVTVLFWCIPLILLPTSWLESVGFPQQESYMFVRMLGWAYLSLCLCYWFGLKSSLQGKRTMGPIWVGILSNGGACIYLAYYGMVGTWSTWGGLVQFLCWASVAVTFFITLFLYIYGIRVKE